jgi:signal peptidase I
MNLMENLNSILWILFGVLTLVEIALRWMIPGFWKNPANAGTAETVDSFWIAMAVALSLKAVLVQPFTIPSGSMEDTLLVNDYILVKKYEYGFSMLNKTPRFLDFHQPQRKDVVVFVYPVDNSKDFIKRCVGIPGDVLEYKNKNLYVNGEEQNEPYVKHVDYANTQSRDGSLGSEDPRITPPDPTGSRDNFGPVTVQPGHSFMMGDNRDNSYDSRYWGAVDEKLVKGQAWFIYWHSVGIAHFLAFAALVTAVITLLLLFWAWLMKSRLSPAEGPPAWRSYILVIVVSVAVAGSAIAGSGLFNFQESCKVLKERMFMVIR